jgi:hypothetical protein
VAKTHPVPIPRSIYQLLDMIDLGEATEWEKIAGIIAFVARQPDQVAKWPPEWHLQMEAGGFHPGTELLAACVKAGVIIRDFRFIPMPGSKWDTEPPGAR